MFCIELNPTFLKIFQTMYCIKSNQMLHKMKMMLLEFLFATKNTKNCTF